MSRRTTQYTLVIMKSISFEKIMEDCLYSYVFFEN